jgi:flagellar motor switch protein FliM
MSEALSSSEIDALLAAVRPGDSGIEVSAAPKPEGPTIKAYDFKRPERFSAERLGRLRAIHEDFARLAAASLSSATRAPASVHLASVDQLMYEEFLRAMPSPTLLASIEMRPARGEALLEISPSLTFALVGLLFGGKGDSGAPAREVTDIERALLEGVIARLLGCFSSAWAGSAPLAPRLAAIEADPRLARVADPSEIVALVTLEARIGEVEGLMNLCLPSPLFAAGSPLATALADSRAPGAAFHAAPARPPRRLEALELARCAIFKAEGRGPTARELASALAEGRGLGFDGRGRFAYEAAGSR